MLLDTDKLKSERQQRAWSQSQLAESSGVSLRTVQRLEKDGKSSLESAKALAAVFNIKVSDLYANEASLEKKDNIPQFCLLSDSTKTLCATLAILGSVIFTIFSPIGLASTSLAITCAIFYSFVFGLLIDAIRGRGFYNYLHELSAAQIHVSSVIKVQISRLATFLFKPVMISLITILLLSFFIYMNMKDYQKQRIMNLLSNNAQISSVNSQS